ncbi:MAG: lysophospholipid acyltransferase family protein [Bacteroidota bacterium]
MIKAIFSGLTFFVLRLFSLLPFAVLKVLEKFLFFLLDKVIHYREDVIIKNLKNAFPEKTDQEVIHIKSRFYRFFSRLIIENIKLFHLSANKLEHHIYLENPDLLNAYYHQGKDVAVMAAHYGNWEWLLGLRRDIPHHSLAIYKPLNNRSFDRLIKKQRSRYGAELVNMREIPRVLLRHAANNLKVLSVFISDQSPVWEEIQYWTFFLNQDTPVYLGPEKLAGKMKMAVVYFRVKVRDNYRYSVEAIPITDDASKEEKFRITERYFSLLEEDIRKAPENWLWSHRRWKLTEKRKNQEKQGVFRFAGKLRKTSLC